MKARGRGCATRGFNFNNGKGKGYAEGGSVSCGSVKEMDEAKEQRKKGKAK